MNGEREGLGSQGRCGSCRELIAIMSEQEQLCARLLELSRAEREAILEGRVDLIEGVTREKAGLIAEMERHEQRRRSIAAEIARELGLAGETSLRSLAAQVGGPEGEELMEIRDRVATAATRLREANEGNLRLMSRSLDAVRDSLRELRRVVGVGDGYTPTGRPHMGAAANVAVDCHA